MAQQAKAGDVGACGNREGFHNLGCVLVQGFHGADDSLMFHRAQQSASGRSGQDAGSDGFGQNQKIARTDAVVAKHLAWMDEARDAEAVFGLRILDGVAAGDNGAGLSYFLIASLKDGVKGILWKLFRKAEDVHGQLWNASHGVNVADGIGGSNFAVFIRVVHDGREDIDSLHQRQIVAYAVHAGVVAGIEANQQVGIGKFGQMAQNLCQGIGAQFGRSAALIGHGRQFDIGHGMVPPLLLQIVFADLIE